MTGSRDRGPGGPRYIIEHLEEGLEEWCLLEYRHVCQIVPSERVLLTRWSPALDATTLVEPGAAPPCVTESTLADAKPEGVDERCGLSLPPWDRICLLDMDASEALEPEDRSKFDAVVFGGILGNIEVRDDGTYGSDDRTSEIRSDFVHRRHLGPMQMTTDTAVLVTQLVLEEGRPLPDIPFLDSPEIGADAAEDGGQGASAEDCVCMEGFRYVGKRGPTGEWEPILPKGMRELLQRSADDDILGSL